MKTAKTLKCLLLSSFLFGVSVHAKPTETSSQNIGCGATMHYDSDKSPVPIGLELNDNESFSYRKKMDSSLLVELKGMVSAEVSGGLHVLSIVIKTDGILAHIRNDRNPEHFAQAFIPLPEAEKTISMEFGTKLGAILLKCKNSQ